MVSLSAGCGWTRLAIFRAPAWRWQQHKGALSFFFFFHFFSLALLHIKESTPSTSPQCQELCAFAARESIHDASVDSLMLFFLSAMSAFSPMSCWKKNTLPFFLGCNPPDGGASRLSALMSKGDYCFPLSSADVTSHTCLNCFSSSLSWQAMYKTLSKAFIMTGEFMLKKDLGFIKNWLHCFIHAGLWWYSVWWYWSWWCYFEFQY